MKKSEMVKALADNFCHAYEIEIHAETIIDFLESQGMQPPACTIEKPLTQNMPIYDRHGKVTYKVTVNEWEAETLPSIIEETIDQALIDQALKHIGRKGVRGEMEITE